MDPCMPAESVVAPQSAASTSSRVPSKRKCALAASSLILAQMLEEGGQVPDEILRTTPPRKKTRRDTVRLPLVTLPSVLSALCMSFLSFNELTLLRKTCKCFKELSWHPIVWKSFALGLTVFSSGPVPITSCMLLQRVGDGRFSYLDVQLAADSRLFPLVSVVVLWLQTQYMVGTMQPVPFHVVASLAAQLRCKKQLCVIESPTHLLPSDSQHDASAVAASAVAVEALRFDELTHLTVSPTIHFPHIELMLPRQLDTLDFLCLNLMHNADSAALTSLLNTLDAARAFGSIRAFEINHANHEHSPVRQVIYNLASTQVFASLERFETSWFLPSLMPTAFPLLKHVRVKNLAGQHVDKLLPLCRQLLSIDWVCDRWLISSQSHGDQEGLVAFGKFSRLQLLDMRVDYVTIERMYERGLVQALPPGCHTRFWINDSSSVVYPLYTPDKRSVSYPHVQKFELSLSQNPSSYDATEFTTLKLAVLHDRLPNIHTARIYHAAHVRFDGNAIVTNSYHSNYNSPAAAAAAAAPTVFLLPHLHTVWMHHCEPLSLESVRALASLSALTSLYHRSPHSNHWREDALVELAPTLGARLKCLVIESDSSFDRCRRIDMSDAVVQAWTSPLSGFRCLQELRIHGMSVPNNASFEYRQWGEDMRSRLSVRKMLIYKNKGERERATWGKTRARWLAALSLYMHAQKAGSVVEIY